MNGSIVPAIFMVIGGVVAVFGLIVMIIPNMAAKALIRFGQAWGNPKVEVSPPQLTFKDRGAGFLVTLCGLALSIGALFEQKIRNLIAESSDIQFPETFYRLDPVGWIMLSINLLIGIYSLLAPEHLVRRMAAKGRKGRLVADSVAWWTVMTRIIGILFLLMALSKILFVEGRR